MPFQASRRKFLTLAGASVGLAATGVREALAQRDDLEPPGLERDLASRVFGPLSFATIVGVAGANLEVELEESRVRYRLKPRHFGDWAHQIGDRVAVAETPSGHRSIQPYVKTVNAPLPNWPARAEIGSVIRVGEHLARIGSGAVQEKYNALQAKATRSAGEEVHWLLVENIHSGELRIFGIMDSHAK